MKDLETNITTYNCCSTDFQEPNKNQKLLNQDALGYLLLMLWIQNSNHLPIMLYRVQLIVSK